MFLVLCLAMTLPGAVTGLSAEDPTQTQSNVTIEGTFYSSIQVAIDAAMPAAVIRIAPGTYHENLVIDKSLTLEGTGKGDVVLNAQDPEHPAVLVQREGTIAISGLTITGAKIGVQVKGSCIDFHDNTILVEKIGIRAWNFAQSESILSGNTISGSTRTKTAQGCGPVVAHVQGTGLVLIGCSRWTIENNRFQGLATGLVLGGRVHALVKANEITHGGDGIRIGVAAQATLTENEVVENYIDGIVLSGSAQVVISDNTIRDNGGWGVRLFEEPRGSESQFLGVVIGEENRIENNGKGPLCPDAFAWLEGFVRAP